MNKLCFTIGALGILFAVVVFAASSYAMPVSPEVIEKLKAEGRFEEFVEQNLEARARGVDKPNANAYYFGLDGTSVDTVQGVIILVDFDDYPKEWDYDSVPDDFIHLLFSRGEHETGSMADYYWETSYQQMVVTGEVAGWYRMPEDYSYYTDGQRGFGQYPRNAQKLAEDAVLAADPDVDFSEYDNDNNDFVDALFIIHAGPGYEDTGNPNYIHSHVWVMSYAVPLDGVYAYTYSMEPEETGSGQLVHMGVFGHEFGHVLGLPDLYDTDYSSTGLGYWSMMAGGSWGNGGRTPVHFDAWCKYEMGWLPAVQLEENMRDVEFPPVEENPVAYRLWTQGSGGAQYFLVENRRKILFDSYIPGEGLLIYHVDENVSGNSNEEHYKVACEQADGLFNLEGGGGADAGDPWPGLTDNRTFDDFSLPNAWDYYEYPTEVAVWNISDSEELMTAHLDVMYDRPLIELVSHNFDDASGNSNGRPEAGETVDFIVHISNLRIAAEEASMTVAADHEDVNFSDNNSYWATIPGYSNADNTHDPITFSLPQDMPVTWITFDIHFEANGGDYTRDFQRTFLSGLPAALIVDDDEGDDLESYYTSAFDEVGLPYDLWDVSSQGRVEANLLDYSIVVWFTGDGRSSPSLSIEDIQDIEDYIDSGNKGLFLTSQDIVQTLTERNEPEDIYFLENYVKANYELLATEHILEGVDGDIIGNGMRLATAGGGGAANQTSQDALIPIGDAAVCFNYTPEQAAAVYHELEGSRIVAFGFGFEAVNGDLSGYNSRPEVLSAVLNYLYGVTDVPEFNEPDNIPLTATLAQNYPNPFNANTNISFRLVRSSNIELSVYNLAGQKVKTLQSGKLPIGNYTILWDGADRDGNEVSSGVYFYRLTGSDFSYVKRMTLMK